MSLQSDFEENVNRLFIKPDDTCGKLLHAAVGIAGESGEILDAIMKSWIYGAELDRENILEECGDILFYVAAMLRHSGYTLDAAMQHNMIKLNQRYPEGYTDSAAIKRNDKIAVGQGPRE